MPTAEQLARLLAIREAVASVALDGETMHEAQADSLCCLDHARERISVLQAEVERVRALGQKIVERSGPQRMVNRRWVKAPSGSIVYRDPHWECDWCGGRSADYDDESPANIDHAESCLADPKRWGLKWTGAGWRVSDGG